MSQKTLYDYNARFIPKALHDLYGIGGCAKIMDLGCGAGQLVSNLRQQGYDAWGCDSREFIGEYTGASEYLLPISVPAYRLPAEDHSFDAVISTSVLEHALNKQEVFSEIYRILKPNGVMLHFFPSKYYLPTEPHIFVPFVSWMSPSVPTWWLALWAVLGCRNNFQYGLNWKETTQRNVSFCLNGLSYWSYKHYEEVVCSIFGNCNFQDEYYARNADGGAARLARIIPLPLSVSGLFIRYFRSAMMTAIKQNDSLHVDKL